MRKSIGRNQFAYLLQVRPLGHRGVWGHAGSPSSDQYSISASASASGSSFFTSSQFSPSNQPSAVSASRPTATNLATYSRFQAALRSTSVGIPKPSIPQPAPNTDGSSSASSPAPNFGC